jgi:hypothetical protein
MSSSLLLGKLHIAIGIGVIPNYAKCELGSNPCIAYIQLINLLISKKYFSSLMGGKIARQITNLITVVSIPRHFCLEVISKLI